MITIHNQIEREGCRTDDPISRTINLYDALKALIVSDLNFGAQILMVTPTCVKTQIKLFGGHDTNEYVGSERQMRLLYEVTLTFIRIKETQIPQPHLGCTPLITKLVMVDMLLKHCDKAAPHQKCLINLPITDLLSVFLLVVVSGGNLDHALASVA